MYNFLLRRGTSIAFIVGFIASIILVVAIVTSGATDFPVDDFPNLYPIKAFGLAVGIGRLFVILGVIAIFVGGVYGLITNPKSAIKFVIGFLALLAIFAVLYFIAKDETTGPISLLLEEYNIQGGISKMISGGIILTLILLVISFAAVLLAELRNAFK